MSGRFLVVVAGFPGVGKSTLSGTVCDVLSARTGTAAIALSSDDVIPIQCADALHAANLAGPLPYRATGDGIEFDPDARERLSARAVTGLAQLLALLGPRTGSHLVAELPSRWAPLFLDAVVRTGLTDAFSVLGLELLADPATCQGRNRRRARQLPSDAVRLMTLDTHEATWGPAGDHVLSARASISTEGQLDAVRGEVAERCASLLDRTAAVRQ